MPAPSTEVCARPTNGAGATEGSPATLEARGGAEVVPGLPEAACLSQKDKGQAESRFEGWVRDSFGG